MTQLERQIRITQRRLWLNRWLHYVSWSVAVAAGVFAAVVLVDRLYALQMPVFWIGVGLAGAALLTSIIRTVMTREDAALASATLDQAAGLKERLSSGHYCQGSDDPFAQAVVADAEHASASLSARQHIRLKTPNALALGTGSIVVAALMFLITPGLLRQSEVEGSPGPAFEAQQAKVAVKRKLDDLRKMAEANPVLEDLKENLEGLDKHAGGKLQNPSQIRHEAVKKIDKLADSVKQKRRSSKYDTVKEMRKMMRGLKVPKSSDAPTQKLARALAQGDFKTAKEEINALKEQLATLKAEKDKEMVVKLSKQLEDLSKQLEKLSKDQQLAQKLQQAGIKKEDLERLLENLKKKDLDQLKKQLADKGFSQQDIDKIAKQLQRKQQTGAMANELAKGMQQASQCKNPGQMGNAIAGLSMAADQLTELETLEQEMTQLDATLTALQDAQNDLDKPCPTCRGTGMVNGGR